MLPTDDGVSVRLRYGPRPAGGQRARPERRGSRLLVPRKPAAVLARPAPSWSDGNACPQRAASARRAIILPPRSLRRSAPELPPPRALYEASPAFVASGTSTSRPVATS